MKLWLSKNSEAPIREQIVTQIRLAILAGDLKPGEKLPSTRELARRYGIHANTVSAAFRELEERGWVRFAHGSGVYVRKFATDFEVDEEATLDHIISEFLKLARSRGHSLSSIQARMRRWLEYQAPDHFLLIEPDPVLREILAAEISEATDFPVVVCDLADSISKDLLAGAMPIAVVGQGESVRKALPAHSHLLLLKFRSVQEALKDEKRPAESDLIIVASVYPVFLEWSHAVFNAIGIDPMSFEYRLAGKKGWERGLSAARFVVADTVTARTVPQGCAVRVFQLISDVSLTEIRDFVNYVNCDT